MAGKRDKSELVVGPPRLRVNTLDFPSEDPKLDSISFVSARLRLYSLRQFLSSFSLVKSDDPNGFRFDSFIRNLAGLKTLALSGTDYDFARTGHGIYLVCPDPTAAAALSSVTGVDLKKSSEVSNGKELLSIVRLSSSEMAMIEALSCSPKPSRMSIVPDSVRSAVDIADFRTKLAGCKPISGEGFDPLSFSGTVVDAGIFNDDQDRLHYALATSDGTSYALYVNSNPHEHSENPLVFVGRYALDVCYLYRLEVV